MSRQTFDDFTPQAGEMLSRRSSLMTLGGAALAAVAATPSLAEAKQRCVNSVIHLEATR